MRPFTLDRILAGLRLAILLLCAAVLAGCAAQRYQMESERHFSEGNVEQGLASLREAMRLDPGNAQYRLLYANRIRDEVKKAVERAESLRAQGDMTGAREAYLAALKFDSGSEQARRGMAQIDIDIRHAAILADAEKLLAAGKLDAARERVLVVRHENPANVHAQELLARIGRESAQRQRTQDAELATRSIMKKPVTLQFRDANVRMVFEALSRTTGLNVVFDRDVRSDLKTTIFVRDGTLEDTVDLILLQNQLEKKVLNANTLFIYPATAAKEKEYQDLKVQTFRISNGNAKYIQSMLKSVLKIKEIQLDEQNNTLVLRDTPEALAVAAKVIAANDLPDAEVMLEVEVLEVSRDRLTDLGVKWPDRFGVATPTDANGSLTYGALRRLNRDQLLVTPLQMTANFKWQDTDANILASPRIRVRDREKARILIGDKVPVITNAVTPVSTGSAVVTGSIQYIDVGIKLEAEPHVYDEGEIGIKLNLEVSNIVKEITGAGGSLAYQIGTRMASTSLRLRDGETQVLGGLISDSDRNTAAKVPGIGDLPILGKLFSENSGDRAKNEIVLSITPHIVRARGVAEDSMANTWSGTESTIREKPLRLDPVSSVNTGVKQASADVVTGGVPTPASQADALPAPAPAVAPAPAAATTAPVTASATPAPATATVPAPAAASEARASPAAAPPTTTPSAKAIAPVPAVSAADTAPHPAHVDSVARKTTDSGPQIAWGDAAVTRKGEQFTVTVNGAGFNGVRSVPLMIRYDPHILSFVSADLGEFGTRAGASASDQVINQNAGRINMTLNPGTAGQFTGSGALMKLTFSALLARPVTQLMLARVDLHEGNTVRTVPPPQPLAVRVDP